MHIKKFTIVSAPDAATRVAMLERGEADIIYFIPGELVARIKADPKNMLAPVVSGNWWLEFPGFQDPKNPFHDKRVREAVSLAIDRDAMNKAECAGLGRVDGNWINDDVQYGLEWPKWEHNIEKAKQLMAEAGYPEASTTIGSHRRRPIFRAASVSSRNFRRLASVAGCRVWSAASTISADKPA